MKIKQVLTEARVHGELSQGKTVLGFSSNGSDIIAIPQSMGKDALMKFKFDSNGIAILDQIRTETKDLPYREREPTVRQLLTQRWSAIYPTLAPLYDETAIPASLAKFYRNSIQNKQGQFGGLEQTVAYGNLDNAVVYVGFNPTQYLVADRETKTLSIENKDREYQTRMGTYKSSNINYIVIDSDFTISDQRMLVKSLKSIVRTFPELANYSLIDTRNGEQTESSVQDVIGMHSPIDDILTRTTSTIYAYHGTSKAALKSIIKNRALLPDQGEHYEDKIIGHSDKLIYLTMDIEQTRKYAVRAAKSKPAVVLKVEINDMTRIRFDEDSLYLSVETIPDRVFPHFAKRFYAAFNLQVDPNKQTRENIKMLLRKFMKETVEFTPEQSILVKYITSNILTKNNVTSGVSFGYEGRIPLDKITLVEEFTSVKYNDDKQRDDYNSMYDAIRNNRIVHNKKLGGS